MNVAARGGVAVPGHQAAQEAAQAGPPPNPGQAFRVRSPVSRVFLHPPIRLMLSLQQQLGACFNCECETLLACGMRLGVRCQTAHHAPPFPSSTLSLTMNVAARGRVAVPGLIDESRLGQPCPATPSRIADDSQPWTQVPRESGFPSSAHSLISHCTISIQQLSSMSHNLH